MRGRAHRLRVVDSVVSLALLLSMLCALPAHALVPGWDNTGAMAVARSEHTATLLPNGKVLVSGETYPSAPSELYDPGTGAWLPTGQMISDRKKHTATLLPDGKVLVTGGSCYVYQPGSTVLVYLSSSELYDSAAGTWSAAGSMTTVRYWHTATLLPNGKVLVAGGRNSSGDSLSTAELFDPATGIWTSTASMAAERYHHTAVLLPSGKVLVAGGWNSSSGSLSTAELFDPATGTWSSTGSKAAASYLHTATLLPNGKVLVAGGYNTSYLSSAELYDPVTGTWTTTGSMTATRIFHAAALLPGGKVLVAGGMHGPGGYLSSAELFDPATGIWTSTASMAVDRIYHKATLLPNGKVLVQGGMNTGGDLLSSAELYDPGPGLGYIPLPFDNTNWEGNLWCGNSDYGQWFPSVTDCTARFRDPYDDVCWTDLRTNSFFTVGQTVDFEVKPFLQSGGGNSDIAYFGFGPTWLQPIVIPDGYFSGVGFYNGGIWTAYDFGVGAGLISQIGTYSPGEWVHVNLTVVPGGVQINIRDNNVFVPWMGQDDTTPKRFLAVGKDSSDGFDLRSVNSGLARKAPVDFDGDGKTDIAVYRPSTGVWYILQSAEGYDQSKYKAYLWGNSTDNVVPGDYDGDGKTDIAVYRPSTGVWYILQSTDGYDQSLYKSYLWGSDPTDIPVPEDCDGDGKTDIAVYRASTGVWYILQSSDGYDATKYKAYKWGDPGSSDLPVPGNYDNDGRTDLAVWRPSTGVWYILQSAEGYDQSKYKAYKWGDPASGDIPVPGDFDGDRKTDLAVYRPSTGVWYLLHSADGYDQSKYKAYLWGGPTDQPLNTRNMGSVYSQADLTGMWDIIQYQTGAGAGWFRASGTTFDASGNIASVADFLDHAGNTNPGLLTLKWTLDSTGVVTEFDNDVKTGFHGVMSSEKGLIVGTRTLSPGTGTPSDPGTHGIRIARKRGVAYSPSDLANKALGYHQMETAFGGCNGWEYGKGTIDSIGQLRVTFLEDLCGSVPVDPTEVLGTATIDSDGFVTGMGDFTGFMSPDKTTIFRVATDVEPGGTHNHLLTVFSLRDPGKVFTQADLAGTFRFHAIWEGTRFGWAHGTSIIGADGGATISGTEPAGSWSNVQDTITLTTDGTVLNSDEPSFRGTLSPNNNVLIVTGTDNYGYGELDFQVLLK